MDNSKDLADTTAEFFTGKVQNIRDGLEILQTETDASSTQNDNEVPLTSFPPISAEDL